jgi:hypothetical protein
MTPIRSRVAGERHSTVFVQPVGGLLAALARETQTAKFSASGLRSFPFGSTPPDKVLGPRVVGFCYGNSHVEDPVFVKAAKDMHEAKLLAGQMQEPPNWYASRLGRRRFRLLVKPRRDTSFLNRSSNEACCGAGTGAVRQTNVGHRGLTECSPVWLWVGRLGVG